MTSDVSNAVDEQVVSLDFSEVEDKAFDPLERGRYQVRVIEAEIRQSQSGPYPYLAISFVVDDPEYPDLEGRRLWSNMSFSPKALWNLKGFLRAAGATDEDLSGQVDITPEMLLDVVVVAQVGIEKDQNGEDRNVVKRYFQVVAHDEIEAEVAEEIAAEDAATEEAE